METPILPDDDPASIPSERTMRAGGASGGPFLGRIDHYDLLRKLGGGGFGVVYLARDTASGVDVAVKTLHPLLKHNAEEMDLLREKFKLVHGLTHPNVAKALVLHRVRDLDVRDEDARRELKLSPGDSVMVMDYAPGVTLSKWRRQFPDGVVPRALASEIGRQVAAALDYAHGERIVHRDVKPGNVMVETLEGGRVRARILDFGLAAEIRSSMSRVSTETGDTSGTRPYMAPEQWLGKKQDGRTDQYALACVLYELLSGAPPFAAVFETGDPAVMMAAVERRTPDPVPGLSRGANAALLRALAKDPAARFPSCAAFVDALEKGGGAAAIPPRLRELRSNPLAWAAAAVAAVVAAYAVLSPGPSATAKPSGTAVSLEPAAPAAAPVLRQLGKAGPDDLAAPAVAPVPEDPRAAAKRAADMRTLQELKRAVARRVSSLDDTWHDGGFAEKRAAIVAAQAELASCTNAASLPRAKELRGDVYDAAEWIEDNTAVRNGLAESEKALDRLAADCEAAGANGTSSSSALFRRAGQIREDAAAKLANGEYEAAAAGFVSARTLYGRALAAARSARAASEVENARTRREAGEWDECLAAAERALEWEPDNWEAASLKSSAEEEIERIAEAERKAKEEAERKAREEAERKRAEEEAARKAEAERKAREEAERKAKEEAERKRAEEEAARKAEAERKAKEEAERKRAEEEAARRAAAVRKEIEARAEALRKERENAELEKVENETGFGANLDDVFAFERKRPALSATSAPQPAEYRRPAVAQSSSSPSVASSSASPKPTGEYAETVDGIPWKFSILNGQAFIGGRRFGETAIPTDTAGAVSIPERLGGAPVTKIWVFSFNNCSNITSVFVPDGVVSGVEHVEGARLESVSIPAGYSSFGSFTPFPSCPSLKTIHVAPGNRAFVFENGMLFSRDRETLIRVCPGTVSGSVAIPEGTKTIRHGAFYYCARMTSVHIPDSVERIERGAFLGCDGLKSIDIPAGVTDIEANVFCCPNLSTIRVHPDNTRYRTIDGMLFSVQGELVACPRARTGRIDIPPGTKSIGDYVFSGCWHVSEVSIPQGVETIGERAFHAVWMESIDLPSSLTSIGSEAFSFCSQLKSVSIPSSVTEIGENAFNYCRSLETVSLPSRFRGRELGFPKECQITYR